MRNLEIYCFNGRPSSGKDTQADRLMGPDVLGDKISSGDVARGAIKNEGEFAKYHDLIAPHAENSNNGGLIPDEVVVEAMNDVLKTRIEGGVDRLFLTGYPRTKYQVPAMDQFVKSLQAEGYNVNKYMHILLDASEDQAISRAATRRQFAIDNNQPIRSDDDPKKIGTRLSEFNNLTQPMIDQLSDEGRLKVVPASGSIEEVFSLAAKAIDSRYQTT